MEPLLAAKKSFNNKKQINKESLKRKKEASKDERREALKDNTPKQEGGHDEQRLLMVTDQIKSTCTSEAFTLITAMQ